MKFKNYYSATIDIYKYYFELILLLDDLHYGNSCIYLILEYNYYTQVLNIYKSLFTEDCLNSICIVNNNQGEYKEALDYYTIIIFLYISLYSPLYQSFFTIPIFFKVSDVNI
jgi:hypothetical protein